MTGCSTIGYGKHGNRRRTMKGTGRLAAPLLAALLLAPWATAAWGAGNAGTRVIKKVTHTNSQRLFIAGDSAWKNPDVCDVNQQIVLVAARLSNEAVYREMFAMIMAAHVAGRSVNVRVKGCIDIQGETFPVVNEITVR
jgi:hypothetical protein